MVSERNIEGVVISTVAQKINSVPVGLPEVYDLSDGTVRVYVCVELKSKTEDLLGETYDNLTKEQILGVDYDKQKFINDNIDTIKKLQNKLE